MITRKTFACLLSVLLVNCFAFSMPVQVDPSIMVSWESADGQIADSWSMQYGEGNAKRTQDDKGPHRFTIQDQQQLGMCDIDVTMDYDEDPFVSVNFALTNNAASDLIFTITLTSPINPAITPSTLYGGSTSGSYTDTGWNDSILISTVSDSPLYQGMIDGGVVLPFYPHETTWTSLPGAGGSGIILPKNESTVNSGPAANSTIGIQYKFLLSADDSVGMEGTFEVLPVPEPATLSILGLGGLLMLRKKH